MNLNEYLSNPCRSLSIPYWKNKIIETPPNIQIIHEKDFLNLKFNYLKSDRFFRLIHRLKMVSKEDEIIQNIDMKNDINELIYKMNSCYQKEKIRVSKEDIKQWISRSVFQENLWVKIVIDGKIIASGIAEFDFEAKEGVLEWIQVLPKYQRRGYGKLIINALLNRLSKKANFVTVSGRLDNTSNPKKIYTDCGFEGNDIWYVCTTE
ncbi:MAG: GNAT family N-acetyltransferase [Firmicutes bacterium]|nr:GNAT family N-acetyltransferase [Bacillota bacterium]